MMIEMVRSHKKESKVMHTQTTSTVLNGTPPRNQIFKHEKKAAAPPKYQTYVDNFRATRKKSSESILDLCQIVAEAELVLERKDFKKFLEGIDVKRRGSTFRKLRAIGEAVSRLKPHSSKLPTSWTTIYQIASLETSAFDRLVREKMLTPTLTAKQIKAAFNPCTPKAVSRTALVKVTVRNIDAPILDAIRAEIERLCAKHNVHLDFPKRTANANSNQVQK